MRNHVGALVGTGDLGDLVLDLLTGSLAPTTYNNYGTGMRRFTFFCNEEGITPLEATVADMLRFTPWLARAGTVAANSLQSYFSAINKFFRDHHLKEQVAMGPLLTDARRDSPCKTIPSPTPPFAHQSQHPSHNIYYYSPTDTTALMWKVGDKASQAQ
jgi:hypothetical protein